MNEFGDVLKNKFDRIYIINLHYRTDRLSEIHDQLMKVGLKIGGDGVERFEAVRPAEAGCWPSVGAQGCFMSHLGILKAANANCLNSILIIEDDFDWSHAFCKMSVEEASKLFDGSWQFLHGGMETGAGPIKAIDMKPESGAMQTHFIALRSGAISRAAEYLERMAARSAGSMEGGPMHVDGAYSWFRRNNPDIPAVIFYPAIGTQRPSKTDIADLSWFDRMPVLSRLIGFGRKLKTKAFKHFLQKHFQSPSIF